jgi:proline iminopeptidase
VALQNAIDYPGMAWRTVVSSGVASMRWLEGVADRLAGFEPIELRRQVTAAWDREPELVTAAEAEATWFEELPFHFADPLDPRIDEYTARSAGGVYSADVLRTFASAGYGGIEVEDRLDEIAQPLLVLAGRHDRTCTPEASEAIAARAPGAALHVFERSAHMAFVEEPDEYIAVVGEFLTSNVESQRGTG